MHDVGCCAGVIIDVLVLGSVISKGFFSSGGEKHYLFPR